MERTPTSSRPHTPVSPLQSLAGGSDHGLHLDDDLTSALAALRTFSSRSSDTPLQIACCCGRDDCDSLLSWRDACQKLERELVLSAEVGQALLHRHEAYVRSQESVIATAERNAQLYADAKEKVASITSANNQLVARMSHLVKESNMTEKRLMQTMLNLEVSEASNRTLLQEVQECRGTITKLSAQGMKAVGWEARVYSLQQERDDLREERKAESARAKTAEARANALSEKCSKLQAELYNLREEKELRRLSKADLSEEIIREARMKLEALQVTLTQSAHSEDAEYTRVLESVVSENEALKHDNAELQNLLTDNREELRTLREEMEERRATALPNYDNPQEGLHFFPLRSSIVSRGHKNRESWASTSSAPAPLSPPRSDGFLSPRLSIARTRAPSYSNSQSQRASASFARKTPSDQGDERPSTEGQSSQDNLPPSPSVSVAASRRTSLSRHSNYSIEVDSAAAQLDTGVTSPPKGRRKPLLLLTRSRGTQTDPVVILPSSPHFIDEHTPSGTHSDTSSFQEGRISQFAILLDKVNGMLHRITQADVRTLTNRLKRQHLAGADVGHLSRATISGILNEVSALRGHFRTLLEDERSTTLVSRKEFRALLKTFSELFQEIGSLRASINEVVLNPQIATKLREEALAEPGKEEPAPKPTTGLSGWIAPLSKLWATSTPEPAEATNKQPSLAPNLARSGTVRNRLPPPRIAPKMAPAVSASTTTVNVEFTNAGIRRAISTTPTPNAALNITRETRMPSPLAQTRPQLRGIFAGSAGTSRHGSTDKPPEPRRTVGIANTDAALPEKARAWRSRQLPRDAVGDKEDIGHSRRLSRAVDAVVDQHAIDDEDEEEDDFPDLLQRTLRPRGLSDSSVHSSMMNHGPPVNRILTPAGLALSSPTLEHSAGVTGTRLGRSNTGGYASWLDRDSVLQSLSRKVQGFRLATGSGQLLTTQLPGDDDAPVQADAATGTSTPGGTPTAAVSTLPSGSPPKAIPNRSTSGRGRLGNGSLSPTSRSPLADDSKRGSPRDFGLSPGTSAKSHGRLQHVREGLVQPLPGSYRKPSALRDEPTIGRSYNRDF